MADPQGFTPPPVHHAHAPHVGPGLPPPHHFVHPDVVRADRMREEERLRRSLEHPGPGLCVSALFAAPCAYLSFRVVVLIGWWAIIPPVIVAPVMAVGIGYTLALAALLVLAFVMKRTFSKRVGSWLGESSQSYALPGAVAGGVAGTLAGVGSSLF